MKDGELFVGLLVLALVVSILCILWIVGNDFKDRLDRRHLYTENSVVEMS